MAATRYHARMKKFRLTSLVVAATLLCAAEGMAQSGPEDLELARQSRALSGQIMSPFCPGRTLSDCPSPNAAEQRDRIHSWLAAGVSETEIKARLERELGQLMALNSDDRISPTLSAVPEGAAGWIVPILVLIAGAAVLITVLVRLQRKPALPAVPSSEKLRAIEAELDAELAARGVGGRPPRA